MPFRRGEHILPRNKENPGTAAAETEPPRAEKDEITYLRQKFGSMMMRGYYKECFKLIEDNLNLLYFKERWPDSFFASLRIHKKCYPSMDISTVYEDYLTSLLKKHNIPVVFVRMLRGTDSSIIWKGDFFKDLAITAQGKGSLEEALDYCQIYIKLEPTNSNAFLLKGWILEAMDQNEQATEAFLRSVELNETNYQAYRSLAKYYTQSQPQLALEYINKAVELAPHDPRILSTKAGVLARTGDRAGAMEYYEQASQLDPRNPKYPYRKGELLLADGQTLAAMRQYSRAVGVDEKHLPSLIRLANLCAKDQPDLALPYINTVCSMEPDNLPAALLRGKLLLRTGDTSLALKQYQQVLAIDPKSEEAHASLGELYLNEKPALAIQSFDAAIALGGGKSGYHLGKARALEQLGDIPQAVKEYQATVALDKTVGVAWGAMGLLLAESQPAAAADYLARAIAIIPDNPVYYQARGRALLKLPKRLNEAISCLDSAVKHDPGNADYHLLLAQQLEQTGNTTSAIRNYHVAASLDNSLAPAFYGLARLLQHSQPDLAITHINSAITLDATNGEYYFLKARILDALGNRSDSLLNLQRSVAAAPRNTDVMQELSEVLSGESPRVALMYINRAIELAPDNSLYICTRANILFNVGRQKQALSQYEQALALDPKNHEALFGIGRVLAAGGDPKALDYLDKAIALNASIPQYHMVKAELLGKDAATYPKALACYDDALALDNQQWDVLLAKARLQDQWGDLLGAQENYRRALLVNRGCLEATARMGELLAERGLAAGLSYLDQAIALDPGCSRYHVQKAQIYYALGNTAAAEDACREALSLGAEGDEVYYTLARSLSQKLPETALRHLRTAISLAPDNLSYYLQLGDVLCLLDEDEQAKAAYQQALELDAGCHEALAKTAAILYRQGSSDSLELIDRALELCPDAPDYLYIKAGILHDLMERIPEAIEYLVQAVKLRPEDLQAREMLALMLAENKNYIKAALERRKLEKLRRRIQAAEEALGSTGELPPEPEKPRDGEDYIPAPIPPAGPPEPPTGDAGTDAAL